MVKFDLFFFEQHFDKGLCRVKSDTEVVVMYEKEDSYVIQTEPISETDMVCSMKSFYSDSLTLMTEGKYLKNGETEIGIWKTYNRFGEIIEEIDYEEGWNTHWEDLLQLMQKINIDYRNIVNISRYVEESEKDEEQDEESRSAAQGRFWSVTVISKLGTKYIEYVFDSDKRKKVFEKHQKIS